MIVGRVIGGIVGALVTVRYGLGLYAWRVSEKLEKPKYSVVETLPGGIEIRSYEAYVVAEATMRDTPIKSATGRGFGACAGYIFGGKNKIRGLRPFAKKESRSFSMTAPVRMEVSERATKVSFVMSAEETMRSLPVPTDALVSLRQIKPHTAAFVGFSGPPPSEERVARERRKLEDALATHGYAVLNADETLTYGYHDPFATPNLLRRNEVGLYVRKKRW